MGGGSGSSPSSPIAPQMSSLPASPLQYLNKPDQMKKNTLSPSPVPEIVLTPSGRVHLLLYYLSPVLLELLFLKKQIYKFDLRSIRRMGCVESTASAATEQSVSIAKRVCLSNQFESKVLYSIVFYRSQ